MSRDIALPQRRSIRLPQYDYGHCGAYFVTICTLNRECLFGEVVQGEMQLSEAGLIAEREWLHSAEMRREVELDAFVIMPNHLHAIVVIVDTDGARNDDGNRGALENAHRTADAARGTADAARGTAGAARGTANAARGTADVHPPTGVHRTPLQRPPGASLGALINGYKAAVTRSLTASHIVAGSSVWQRNYYEHVIRNDEDLGRIRRYILDNPAKWALDRENPNNRPPPRPGS